MNWKAAAVSFEQAAVLELQNWPKHRTMRGVGPIWLLEQAALCHRRADGEDYLREYEGNKYNILYDDRGVGWVLSKFGIYKWNNRVRDPAKNAKIAKIFWDKSKEEAYWKETK